MYTLCIATLYAQVNLPPLLIPKPTLMIHHPLLPGLVGADLGERGKEGEAEGGQAAGEWEGERERLP